MCAHAARGRQLSQASAQLDADGRWVNGVTESWWQDDGLTREDAAAAAARWKEIGDGLLARPGAGAWTGDYFRGSETHGTYMRWSPGAGFVIARVDKCRAAVMGITYGRVEATPTLVQFFPESEKHSSHSHGGHSTANAPLEVIRFVPVVWRGERLLVSADEMEEFGDYVAGVGSYNGWSDLFIEHTVFFSHSGVDAAEPGRDAPPAVPTGYERFLKRPVEANVTSIGKRVFRREFTVEGKNMSRSFARVFLTYVTLDAGTEQGVKDKMVFRAARRDEDETVVVVVRAGRRRSTAVVVGELDEQGRTARPEQLRSKVARGWKLTTAPV